MIENHTADKRLVSEFVRNAYHSVIKKKQLKLWVKDLKRLFFKANAHNQ